MLTGFLLGLYWAVAFFVFVVDASDHASRGRDGRLLVVASTLTWPIALPLLWFWHDFTGERWHWTCYVCGSERHAGARYVVNAGAWWHAFRSPSCRREGLPFWKLVIERLLGRRIWSAGHVATNDQQHPTEVNRG